MRLDERIVHRVGSTKRAERFINDGVFNSCDLTTVLFAFRVNLIKTFADLLQGEEEADVH